MHIKFIQDFIDVLRGKKKLPFVYRKEIKEAHKRYSVVRQNLMNKIRKGQKVKVAFLVVYDGSFPAKPIFEKMLEDENFEPFIVVIPDTLRGVDNMFYQMDKTYKTLSCQYKQVFKSYDEVKKKFVDYTKNVDVAWFANPYDAMTHKLYTTQYFAKKNILAIYMNYGYAISKVLNDVHKRIEYNILWKIFTLGEYEYSRLQKNVVNGKNAVLISPCKMDALAKYKEYTRERKKIIIAPHHTVKEDILCLSNFLRYSDFFLELPKLYPDIDFVFRPHPLLFVNLSKENIWDKEKIKNYISRMVANPNIEYQEGGDYFETFVNSDALIHDCGSFSAEYLYTGHPCCYMLKDTNTNNKNSNAFHKECLKQHYLAFSKEEIINFIEDIVIRKNDFLKESRKKFFENKLKGHYPHNTEYILNYLKKELGI